MRRAFISFLTITLICVGVFAVTANQHRDGPQVVTVATITTAPPGSVSHPFQFTLTAAFAPLGPWLDGARHAHDVGVMEEAAIYKAQHTPAAPRPTRVVSSFAAPGSAVYATGSVGGYPCGGALPSCCTLTHESHGTPTAQNPDSSASGLWQFLDSTWHNVTGLPGRAADYPADVQNAAAAKLWSGGAGASNWTGDGCGY